MTSQRPSLTRLRAFYAGLDRASATGAMLAGAGFSAATVRAYVRAGHLHAGVTGYCLPATYSAPALDAYIDSAVDAGDSDDSHGAPTGGRMGTVGKAGGSGHHHTPGRGRGKRSG